METKLLKKYLLVLLLPALFFAGCSKEEVESKSMEQLQAENGIPVTVEKIEPQHFEKTLDFFGQLSGIKQSINGAMIGGRVEKINVKVGDWVKKGDIIAEWPNDATAGMYIQTKSAYEMAEKNYTRMKALLEAGQTSQANFDGVKTQYEVAKRNFELQNQLYRLEAPFDGMITNIAVNEGDNIDAKKQVFTIAQLYKMKTKVWANEDEIQFIKKGMKAITKFRGVTYTGKVTDVAITPDPAKQAFYVEVEFDNHDKQLITGITLGINIVIYETDNALLVPRNIVKQDKEGMYVFVNEGGKAAKRYVKNGVESGIYYQVNEGLNIGDILIVKGSGKLENGSKINVIE